MKLRNQQSKSQPSYGIVCLVDALGAKNFNDEENLRFLDSRQVIQKAIHEKAEKEIELRSISRPKVAVFNDTIIIAIQFQPDSEEEYNACRAMAFIVRKLIVDGISKGIFFRGAIGLGSFIADLKNDTIIGQAVTDAANWYDVPNLIGCIASPRFSFLLKELELDSSPKSLYITHSVPTKDGDKAMSCVNWPRVLFSTNLRPTGCATGAEDKWLYSKFSDHFIPKAAEVKFENTAEFFKMSVDLSEKESEG